jgi:hypothetical protein
MPTHGVLGVDGDAVEPVEDAVAVGEVGPDGAELLLDRDHPRGPQEDSRRVALDGVPALRHDGVLGEDRQVDGADRVGDRA